MSFVLSEEQTLNKQTNEVRNSVHFSEKSNDFSVSNYKNKNLKNISQNKVSN